MIVPDKIPELDLMKHYPSQLHYKGSLELLERPKISIVGTRRPNPYTRAMTFALAQKISQAGGVVVSGAALGVDAIAHSGAGTSNTIAVLPCGIDIYYPSLNKELIASIERQGLTLSCFDRDFRARDWSFVVRNEIVVAMGGILIVTEADMNSGSMRSVEYALEMGKKIYVLPHRINESSGTQRLLEEKKAEAIYDIDAFISNLGMLNAKVDYNDPFLLFCISQPTYEEAIVTYPDKIFEAELAGTVEIRNGKVMLV